jgi:hypothetical protein
MRSRIHRQLSDYTPGDRAKEHTDGRDLIVGNGPGHETGAKHPAQSSQQVEGELPAEIRGEREQDGEGRARRQAWPTSPEHGQQPGERAEHDSHGNAMRPVVTGELFGPAPGIRLKPK